MGRRTRCFRGRRAAASGFRRELTINVLFGGDMWQGVGVGGARRPSRPPSETTSLDVPRASRSVAAAFFAKDKKRCLEYCTRREATLPVLDRLENVLENAVTRLTGKELEVLLRWKGVPVSKMGNVANRRVLYQHFTDGGEEE